MIYDEWVFHDVEHIYLQLIKKIGCAIYSGQLSTGEKIPSVREMAKILYINPNTVMSAWFNTKSLLCIYTIALYFTYIVSL